MPTQHRPTAAPSSKTSHQAHRDVLLYKEPIVLVVGVVEVTGCMPKKPSTVRHKMESMRCLVGLNAATLVFCVDAQFLMDGTWNQNLHVEAEGPNSCPFKWRARQQLALHLHMVIMATLLFVLLLLCHAALLGDTGALTRYDFPNGFIFGAGTLAFQVEGTAAKDGRKPSISDTFTHQDLAKPSKIWFLGFLCWRAWQATFSRNLSLMFQQINIIITRTMSA